MLDTRTRLHAAMPAERSASSNEVSFSRCFPTPLVKNISFGTNPTTLTLLVQGTCMVNSKFPTVKEPRRLRRRIIVRSPNNDARSGARERARHPGNHSARNAHSCGGAPLGRRNARAGALRPALDPECAATLAHRARRAPGRESADDVQFDQRDGRARMAAPDHTRRAGGGSPRHYD